VITVSFSGIDGAGKTTQILALESWLKQAGLGVEVLTFWDNIVAFPRLREFISQRAFKGDQGVGSPQNPLRRRDKNVTSWPVTYLRFCFYLADALSLCWKVRKVRMSEADVTIFDRYIYDELANLPLHSSTTRSFVRMTLKLVPHPDVAFVIDADPDVAYARKPEYPLEFLRTNRAAYLALSRLTPGTTVIEPLPIDAAVKKIRQTFLQQQRQLKQHFSELPALP
jgi:thymidylate kinase